LKTQPALGYVVSMPTVIYIDGFRIMVLTQDHPPAHVHVSKAGRKAKIYLGTWEVEGATMDARDLARTMDIVRRHEGQLMEVWRQIHGD
jgi:hypothetical protein